MFGCGKFVSFEKLIPAEVDVKKTFEGQMCVGMGLEVG
jgi:hypothetical protein